jgi:hypothetical protein
MNRFVVRTSALVCFLAVVGCGGKQAESDQVQARFDRVMANYHEDLKKLEERWDREVEIRGFFLPVPFEESDPGRNPLLESHKEGTRTHYRTLAPKIRRECEAANMKKEEIGQFWVRHWKKYWKDIPGYVKENSYECIVAPSGCYAQTLYLYWKFGDGGTEEKVDSQKKTDPGKESMFEK